MTDKRLSQLPELENLTGNELLYVVSGGAHYSVKAETLAQELAGQTVDKESLQLDQVDNTRDLDKPISTATQSALDTKANIADLELKADQTTVESVAAQLDTKSNLDHTHAIADVEGLADALAATVNQEAFDQNLQLKANAADQEALDMRVTALEQSSGSPGVSQEDFNALDARVTTIEETPPSGVTQGQFDALSDIVSNKADQSDLSQAVLDLQNADSLLSDRITVLEQTPGDAGVSQEDFDALVVTVNTKADSNTVNALQVIVDNKADQADVITSLADKADNADVVNLTQRVTALEETPATGGVAQEDFDSLVSTVNTKADQTTVDSLSSGLAEKANSSEVVSLSEQVGLKASQQDLDALQSVVNQKANTSTVDALSGRVDALEQAPSGGITQQDLDEGLALKADVVHTHGQADIVGLEDALALKAEVSDLNTLTGRVSNAEAALSDTVSQNVFSQLVDDVQLKANAVDLEALTPKAAMQKTRMLFVSSDADAEVATGSYAYPFRTIQDALDSITNKGTSYHIQLLNGDYNENVVIDAFLNLIIQGMGCVDSHQTRIRGSVTIQGTNTTRARMKDVLVRPTATGIVPLIITDTQGRHYFENVSLEPFDQTTPAINVSGNVSNWIDFNNSNIGGIVNLNSTAVTPALFAVRNGNHDKLVINQNIGFNVKLNVMTRIGHINHVSGNLTINGLLEVVGDSNGIAIDSISVNSMDRISIRNADFQKPDGSYLAINSTGQATVSFNNVNHFPGINVISGVIELANVAHDTRVDFTPVNYAPANASLEAHLQAIDAALGALAP